MKIKYTDFENYLQYKHMEENPMVLDDDLPDSFDNWMAQLDVEELIKYADEFAKYIRWEE